MPLMHEVGVTDLDAWYSDFVETDWICVKRYHEEDAIPLWEECVASGCPVLSPAPIPELKHRKVEVHFTL